MLIHDAAGLGVRVAFTGVAEGNLALHVGDDPAAVARRRAALEARLGVGPGELRFMDQVHSAAVHTVGGEDDGGAPTADALVSPGGDHALAVMVADCVPVVLAARTPAGTATAVAHAGRRGLLDGILGATLDRLESLGATDVRAWIGPAVCGACYEVPEELAAGAEALLPGIRTRTRAGTPALDLPGAAARLLAGRGAAVVPSPACTLEDPAYYSHRRDPASGRFAGVVHPWAGEAP